MPQITRKTQFVKRGTYVDELYVGCLILTSLEKPFRAGPDGWGPCCVWWFWAKRGPSSWFSRRKTSARVALRHTKSSPCSITRLSRSASLPPNSRPSASNISSAANLTSISTKTIVLQLKRVGANWRRCTMNECLVIGITRFLVFARRVTQRKEWHVIDVAAKYKSNGYAEPVRIST